MKENKIYPKKSVMSLVHQAIQYMPQWNVAIWELVEVVKKVDYSKTRMEGFSEDEWWGITTRLDVSQ